tara:strand:+ start:1233 stop:2276 length:1044 start_codon:yes stop_codon:yes gene_type:complete
MTAEQLQKTEDFFKSMGLPLPKGMGGSNDDSEAVEYRTGKAVDPSPKGEEFAGNIEKRVAAAQALADKVKGGISDLATRFATGAGLRDKQLAEDAAGFIAKSDEELSGMDPIEYERPKVTGLSIEEDAADFNSKPDIGGIDSSDYEKGELYGDSDPLDFSYPAERSLEEYGNEDEENSEDEMTQPTRELRQDHLESSKEALGTKSRDKSRQAKEDRKAHLKSSKKAFGTESRDKSRKSKGGYVDPQGGEPLITTEAGRTIDEIGAPERGIGDYAADAMAESAEPAPEVDYTDEAISLFKNTHGGSFDPKSSDDRGKLENMKSMLAERGGLGEMSRNQFALQFYREYP